MSNYPDFSSQGYRIERELGINSSGGRVTYKAKQIRNQEPVVIKQFQFFQSASTWSGYKAVQREINVLKQLNHPRIPRYLDSFETTTGFCLVQEYKHASSLGEQSNFTPEEVEKIARSILEVLVYLQEGSNAIFHRDIKPENILVNRNNGNLDVYLIDFGLARLEEGTRTQTSSFTPGFMPERVYYPGGIE